MGSFIIDIMFFQRAFSELSWAAFSTDVKKLRSLKTSRALNANIIQLLSNILLLHCILLLQSLPNLSGVHARKRSQHLPALGEQRISNSAHPQFHGLWITDGKMEHTQYNND